MMDTEYIVVTNDVYKQYASNVQVLKGLSMKIATGSMYGLLGPSGCGKTTLLQCILGRLSIDSGTIKLGVKKRREVGYMPQGTSLHTELKLGELFTFYGTLFSLYGETLSSRVRELSDLLELPPLTRLISECSGGQQRRISLAITLLHNPKLLLLDEPTVGLDPLLSQRIWIYLKNLCCVEKKTLIVTTHYMEEARTLHMIGLMRGGVLLAENPPENLIDQYHCSTLDDVFFVLSQKQFQESRDVVKVEPEIKNVIKQEVRLESEKAFNFDHVKAQMYRNYKWTYRNTFVTLFVLLLPMMAFGIIGFIFSHIRSDLKIGYYSEDYFNASCNGNETVFVKGCPPSLPYSCNFIHLLEKLNHPMMRFNTVEEGIQSVKSGQSLAMIYFPFNFTNTIIERMTFRTPKKNDSSFKETPATIWMDNTLYTIAFHGQIDIYLSLQKMIEQKSIECGINTKLASTPLNYQPLVHGEKSSLSSRVFPHFMNAFLLYMTFVYTGASILMEKTSGVLDRIQTNGMKSIELLTANYIVLFIILIIQNAISIGTIYYGFGEYFDGSLVLMIFILFLNEYFGSITALLLMTFNTGSVALSYVGVGGVLSITLTGGSVWPTEAISKYLKPLAQLIPVNAASESFSQVVLHGFEFMHRSVYPGVLYLIGCNLLATLLFFLRIRKNNYQL